jgi:hypothetical protein
MRRRDFTVGVLLAVATRSGRAEQRATPPRIAIFHPAIPTTSLRKPALGGVCHMNKVIWGYAIDQLRLHRRFPSGSECLRARRKARGTSSRITPPAPSYLRPRGTFQFMGI